MARPRRSRRVCSIPAVDRFTPDPQPRSADNHLPAGTKTDTADPAQASTGTASSAFEDGTGSAGTDREPVILTIDEYEVLRLVDHEGLTHSECARQMNISRTTASEICASARRKVAAAIVCCRELVIEGGRWELCEGNREDCFLGSCTRAGQCGTGGGDGDSAGPAPVSHQT